MSKSTRTVIAILLLFAGMASATADCFYNGKKYPDGTVIGDRVCSGGRWVRRD
jgi:hypothetical protein